MTRSCWLWASLAASMAAHGLFAWQLSGAPREPRAARDLDTFEVRMVAPPPPPEPEPVPEPKPVPPPPPPPKAKPVVKSPEPSPVADPPPAEPRPVVAPEPTTAPAALLADTGPGAGGSIVQLAGAPIGALSMAAPSAPPEPAPVAAAAAPVPVASALAKLSDLSRKPKAPPLDSALRQNYPAELRRRGTEGQAEVRVVIDPRGRVGEVALVSESAVGFADACRKTLVGSRWSEPLDREGQPVSTRLTYRCRFQIER